jgi:hypothetical protein
MVDTLLHTAQALREEAELYLRLARDSASPWDYSTVMEYAQELLERARRMEAALKATEG